ncbi:ABC transporter ATP-binding protein [Fulvivirgaceae bacterium BMA10]|uniref:ABC transporter ATP-binding protein n=1 Tax=Splendidivirga corallicola TaxID=3051826 RepID=A0ABT8KPD8_9BACT|nr:ABC transporter ATP-binding protein [Fulvivirgaceae bacterium BMA10]
MDIHIHNLSKKFNKEWIFKDINFNFKRGNSYSITGPNGSGKSTLLQIISGSIPATKGTVVYKSDQEVIDPEYFYQYQTQANPYLELIEEFTLPELLKFHFTFKKIAGNLSISEIINRLYLEDSKHKQIKNFSSGMKQRLKLGLAFFSESDVILLDEPTTNLDALGTKWYLNEVTKLLENTLIIISSNQKIEYEFCNKNIDLRDFKD